MSLSFLPNEIWFKICLDLNPYEISNFILNFTNRENRNALIGISFEIIKKYYSSKSNYRKTFHFKGEYSPGRHKI